MHRLFWASIAACTLAACQTSVVIRDVTLERSETGDLVVNFKADQDLDVNATGLLSTGHLAVRPEKPHDWNGYASLHRLAGAASKDFAYRCRFPSKAQGKEDVERTSPEGAREHFFIKKPYDLSGPGEIPIEFYLIGGGCGCRGLESNVVPLMFRAR